MTLKEFTEKYPKKAYQQSTFYIRTEVNFIMLDVKDEELDFIGEAHAFRDYIIDLFDETTEIPANIRPYIDEDRVFKDYEMDYREYSYNEVLEELKEAKS